MTSRHLPAGQSAHPGGGGPSSSYAPDMAGVSGSSNARRRPQQMMPPYHQPSVPPMYVTYMSYGPQGYYGLPQQYPHGMMPSPGFAPHLNYHARHPHTMQPYAPMVGANYLPNFPRPLQPSPSLSAGYQPPPAPAPAPAPAPLSQSPSTHYFQMINLPSPPVSHTLNQPLIPPPPLLFQQQEDERITERPPFRPPLPWFSHPNHEFPSRILKSRRRLPRGPNGALLPLLSENQNVPPERKETLPAAPRIHTDSCTSQRGADDVDPPPKHEQLSAGQALKIATSDKASEPGSSEGNGVHVSNAAFAHTNNSSQASSMLENGPNGQRKNSLVSSLGKVIEPESGASIPPSDPVPASPVRAAPTTWANLFANPGVKRRTDLPGLHGPMNGAGSSNCSASNSNSLPSKGGATSLAEAIKNYCVDGGHKISFLEPRGLINTGNMCYMNSILQVLINCGPFYDFLAQLGQDAVHSFKSETPLIDAMIILLREYKILAAATSPEEIHRNLRSEDLEKYGEPFTPDFLYEAIRQLSRFASMRRGHQQDAEEFLGFFLQSLDDECNQLLSSASTTATTSSAAASLSTNPDVSEPLGGWLEVGRKQRSAVTRASGSKSSTPITKIFGGLLRSELRVPGLKDSITTEPYQPLQLDIGSPGVRNVIDALRGLTRPERLQGDFNSPRGKNIAVKQVSIESLPPVLVLHLKRFQFDAEGNGTVKIWKKIRYPLDLEIPRDILSRQARQSAGDALGLRYKLIGVVYHHGKNASGGHYTVDVCRQDGRDWIRIDDTVIRRIRREEVAAGGSEDVHSSRRDLLSGGTSTTTDFDATSDDGVQEDGWKRVTNTGGHKRWSNVLSNTVNNAVNGAGKGKQIKDSVKDNKVAYILFYERI